jgi:NAD-dependent dihydropyrimidine dehydrogenase PreA subunit
MGSAATYYEVNGLGRSIDQAEALAILDMAEQSSLVLQPSNAKDAVNICTCCGCCCGILTNVKRQPHPASFVHSAFVATLNTDACEGCGTCELRCQMEAIAQGNGHAILDMDRCIGCGQCVSTCPSDALSQRRKPAAEQPYVPKDIDDNYIRLSQARGKLSTPNLVGMLVRSKVDRLLAPR